MVAKVAGGIIGLGLIGTGGVAFVKPEWLGINKEIPWTPLSKDDDFSGESSVYKGKFGETYKNYLTGVKGNQDWWKESFEKLKTDSSEGTNTPSDQFKFVEGSGKVNKAFVNPDSKDDTALNQICKKVYKETTTNIKASPVSSNSSEYKEDDVWKYCSPLGAVPKLVKDNESEKNNYSGKIWDTKKEELLSIKHEDNQKLWELKNDEFFGTGAFKSNTEKAAPSSLFFKELFSKGNKDKYGLKNRCEDAYKLENTATPDNANKVKDEDVVKYCSFKHK